MTLTNIISFQSEPGWSGEVVSSRFEFTAVDIAEVAGNIESMLTGEVFRLGTIVEVCRVQIVEVHRFDFVEWILGVGKRIRSRIENLWNV